MVGVAGGSFMPGWKSSVHGTEADTPSAVDVGFCTDMSAHHVQALVMCQRVLGRSTGDRVQAAAAEILQNQAIELGQMRAWLADWGEATSPSSVAMAWIHGGHGHQLSDHGGGMPTATMPGMATPAELNELSTLTGRAQGRRWLELMRAHHVGGVSMAQVATRLATIDKVRQLAEAQVAAQSYEIEQFDLLLSDAYRT